MYSYDKLVYDIEKENRKSADFIYQSYYDEFMQTQSEFFEKHDCNIRSVRYKNEDVNLGELVTLTRLIGDGFKILKEITQSRDYSENAYDYAVGFRVNLTLDENVKSILKKEGVTNIHNTSDLLDFMRKMCPMIISIMQRELKNNRVKDRLQVIREIPQNLRTPKRQIWLKGERSSAPQKKIKRGCPFHIDIRKML